MVLVQRVWGPRSRSPCDRSEVRCIQSPRRVNRSSRRWVRYVVRCHRRSLRCCRYEVAYDQSSVHCHRLGGATVAMSSVAVPMISRLVKVSYVLRPILASGGVRLALPAGQAADRQAPSVHGAVRSAPQRCNKGVEAGSAIAGVRIHKCERRKVRRASAPVRSGVP